MKWKQKKVTDRSPFINLLNIRCEGCKREDPDNQRSDHIRFQPQVFREALLIQVVDEKRQFPPWNDS